MASNRTQKMPVDRILAIAATAVLLLLALMQILRGVEAVEVVAVLLFMGIFAAILVFDLIGGIAAAVASTFIYTVFRLPAVDVVGSGAVWRLISSRAAGYLAFGVLGGLAHKQLRLYIAKSSQDEALDPETGCSNARSFLNDLDIEIARADRYGNAFSLVSCDIPQNALESVKPMVRVKALGELGDLVRSTVRTSDRVSTTRLRDGIRVFALLAETPRNGAEIFGTRFTQKIAEMLFTHGVSLTRNAGNAYSYGEQTADIKRLRNEVAQSLGLPVKIELRN
jgi:GGDEF domain-containing protein